MKKSDLLPLLERLELRPSRRLGQNFLVDPNLGAYIARQGIGAIPGHILEIGPGTGSLTRHLLEAGCRVTAVEYDVRLAEYLTTEFAGCDAIRIVQGDATRIDFAATVGDGPWRCISNLPYSVGSPVLGRLLELESPPDWITVLIQKEMAQRLVASPGNGEYGSLTVRVQRQYTTTMARSVSPSVFWPPPEVDSAIVNLALREDRLPAQQYPAFAKLVNAGFGQRRKKLKRLLAGQYADTDFDRIFTDLGMSVDIRAEQLSPGDWDRLFYAVHGE